MGVMCGGAKWTLIIVQGKLIRGFKGLDVGDRVRVELIGTDVERGFIDFARAVESLPAGRQGQGD